MNDRTIVRTKRTSRWATFFGLTLLPFGVASAELQECIKPENRCDPALLCSFEADLASKVAIYQAYLKNSQETRRNKSQKREGVRYDGSLYDAALKEARTKNSDSSEESQRRIAADIFNAKLRAQVQTQVPKYMKCGITDGEGKEVQANTEVLPNWSGMHTSEDCNIYATAGEDTVFLSDLKRSSKACKEFFDEDEGHEHVHEHRCSTRGRRNAGPDPFAIENHIEEEIEAYRYSVIQAANNVQRLGLKCSADPNLKTRRERAKAITRYLKKHQAKGG